MDVPTTWEQGGWVTRELAQDGLFFAYMMMHGSELNKPYRSFPNVHFDERDMDQCTVGKNGKKPCYYDFLEKNCFLIYYQSFGIRAVLNR